MLPEGVSIISASIVMFSSLFSAFLTASLGLGGGFFLLAVMATILPPAAVLPVHGMAQLGANASRFGFLARSAVWWAILWFSVGGLLGALVGARLYMATPPWAIRICIGLFILMALYAKKPKASVPGQAVFAISGFLTTAMTMFVGATGPFVAGVLSTTPFNRTQIVSTHAAMMVIQHGLKSLAFAAMGFAFADWAFLIATGITMGFIGSWLGARVLKRTPEARFQGLFRAILTGFSLYLLTIGLLEALATAK